jgi:hypothetical protein
MNWETNAKPSLLYYFWSARKVAGGGGGGGVHPIRPNGRGEAPHRNPLGNGD